LVDTDTGTLGTVTDMAGMGATGMAMSAMDTVTSAMGTVTGVMGMAATDTEVMAIIKNG
jgi:hypothetical protein